MRPLLSSLLLILLAACGGGGGSSGQSSQTESEPENEIIFGTQLSLQPAMANSPHASTLEGCIKADSTATACDLATLPLLNAEVFERGDTVPTIDDILNRTVVSHAWMGQRLRQVLEQMPDDMLQLFGGVTAVVIAADIRPSFYTSGTGAIYLDAAGFWLTVPEKQVIDQEEDFRSGFGNGLDFVSLFRYVVGNQRAWDFYSLDGPETRTLDDIILPIASLLFHELAHANDIVPPTLANTFDDSLTVGEAAQTVSSQNTATQLRSNQPLNSQLLHDLGQVLFRGVEATAEQQALSPAEVGLAFEPDGASDDYAYSSQFEDVAMLFEEVMMKYHFGVDRELAYTDAPADPSSRFCEEYVVRWGFRNRIADPLTQSRAQFVVEQLLNTNDAGIYFADLTAPISLIHGLDWCANLQNFGTQGIVGESNKPSGPALIPETDLLPVHSR